MVCEKCRWEHLVNFTTFRLMQMVSGFNSERRLACRKFSYILVLAFRRFFRIWPLWQDYKILAHVSSQTCTRLSPLFYFVHNVRSFTHSVIFFSDFLLLDGYLPPFLLLMHSDQILWSEVLLTLSRSITKWFTWCISHQNILKNHASSSTVM